MVNEKITADLCAGVNIDAGVRMRIFRHDSRNQRHLQLPELMCDPVNGNRHQAGIAQDDLIIAVSRRVTVVESLNIRRKNLTQIRYFFEELIHDFLRSLQKNRLAAVRTHLIGPERDRHLLGQMVLNILDLVADDIAHVFSTDAVFIVIPGKKNLADFFRDIDDQIAVQYAGDVQPCADRVPLVAVQNSLDQPRRIRVRLHDLLVLHITVKLTGQVLNIIRPFCFLSFSCVFHRSFLLTSALSPCFRQLCCQLPVFVYPFHRITAVCRPPPCAPSSASVTRCKALSQYQTP